MSTPALQDVIDELKSRGLRAGEEEGAKVVADAEAKAEKTLADAKAKAEEIVAGAEIEAKAMKKQLDAELRQASAVGLEAFQQALEKSFLVPAIDDTVASVLDDPKSLKDVIVATVKSFADSGGTQSDLTVILSANKQKKFTKAWINGLVKRAGDGVKVSFADGFSFGFKIAPEGSGYLFDFTEDGFREIFMGFMAPRFREYFNAQEKKEDAAADE